MRSKGKVFMAVIAAVWMCLYTASLVHAEDFSDARPIQVNQGVQDSVNNGYRNMRNLYQFTTTQDGYVTVKFSNPMQGDAERYWWVRIYNSSFAQLCEGYIAGNRTESNLVATGIAAGTYYISVSSAGAYDVKSTDTYTVTAAFTASDTWEKEFNEEFTSATPMELNRAYHGTIRSGYDNEKDYYKVILEQPGYLEINFANEQQRDTNAYWNVYLYNSSYDYMCGMSVYGNRTSTDLVPMGLDGGTYYIAVQSTDRYYIKSADIYTITAAFTASDTWEKEFNGEFVTATPIKLNTAYNGTIRGGYENENDYYKLEIKSEDYYRLKMTTPILNDSSSYWYVNLYDAAYQELTGMDIYGNNKSHTIDRRLPAGVYYIRVRSSDRYNPRSTAVYQLKVSKWNMEPSQVQAGRTEITSVTPGKRKASIAFTPINVNGIKYQISYKVSKGTWKTQNTSKTSAVIKNLSSEKTYSVRVRGFKKISGKTYYGQWSDIRKVRVK